MANTTNLNLVKPAGTDYALVSVINGNMDIIDSKVGAIPANESAQSQITALNNQIANKVKAVTLEKTVNSGYFTIDVSTDIGSGYSIASINTVYKSGATADQLNLCYTIDGNNIYVRTGSGNQLTNGTSIKVLVLGIK